MLTATIFLPLAAGLALLAAPAGDRLLRWGALAASGVTFALAVVLWLRFDAGAGPQLGQEVEWIPSLGVGYHVALDGISLPIFAMTALLFVCALVFSLDQAERVKEYVFLFLLLETAALGLFAAFDLFLFYVFWDLTLVGMYFVIAIWGHEHAREAALKFFLYTFLGSLAILLAILGLYLSTDPLTTDFTEIIETPPLAEGGWIAALVWFGFALGFAIKTPLVPFHTWLPPAHVEAPAPGSAILAGVLLKMGVYGFLRISLEMLPEQTHDFALVLVVLGLVSVLWGALVALGQSGFKPLVAYTSVNHMGYAVLGIGAAAALVTGEEEARTLALNGAVLQLVSHGLITGALFLFAGVLWSRARTYEMDRFGGLARTAPLFAFLTAVAAFGGLGLPGLSGFVAEFEVFVGTFSVYPWAAALALLGVLITAALFLWMLQRLFLGPLAPEWAGLRDLNRRELASVVPLLAFVLAIGVYPHWVLDVIDGAATRLLAALGGG